MGKERKKWYFEYRNGATKNFFKYPQE
jgi:hypothetical protein